MCNGLQLCAGDYLTCIFCVATTSPPTITRRIYSLALRSLYHELPSVPDVDALGQGVTL